MTRKKLLESIGKAEAFAEKAETLYQQLLEKDRESVITGTRLSGEVRRLSLDLTRSLADLRKP